MRKVVLFFLLCFLIGLVLLFGSIAFKQRKHDNSGLAAAELGARLSFMENQYRERYGLFTADLSRLEAFDQAPLPCPLESARYTCKGYVYSFENPHWLLAVNQSNPALYIAFDLASGTVDCSHAPQAMQSAALCSSFE